MRYEFVQMSGPSFEHHGYRYEAHRIASKDKAFSRNRRFRHFVTLPDGERQELPFPKRFLPVSSTFQLWVECHRGSFALDHEGHRYRPERSNQWTSPKPRFRHRVGLPDGTDTFAPFKETSPMSAQAFELWVRLGLPEPEQFGRAKLSNALMSVLQKLMDQWDVGDDQLSSLVMLHAFHSKG